MTATNEIRFVRGHEETFQFTVIDPNNAGAPVNLTGKTVTLVVDNEDGIRRTFGGLITNAVNGAGTFTIFLADYDVIGVGEFPYAIFISQTGQQTKVVSVGTFIVDPAPLLADPA